MTLRPLIQGTRGVVVSGHPSASLAGLDVLRRGGNAIDAGVAVGLALNVVHVHECGFLGVAPTIIYLADRGEVITIDGVGVWPKAASLDYFLQVHQGMLPPGILRTITPGVADAWFMALGRYGTMSFGDVVGAAIELAEKGFPMHRYLAQQLRETQDRFEGWPTTAEVLMPGGRLTQVGEMFYQRDLANTLARIAGVEEASRSRGREGALTAARDFVYKGELAERMASPSARPREGDPHPRRHSRLQGPLGGPGDRQLSRPGCVRLRALGPGPRFPPGPQHVAGFRSRLHGT